ALEMLRQRRPLEARAWCLDVAARTRADSPHHYKQAMIAASWIAELCGDLAAAREGLEELGAEAAFAADEERLHSLVRVYHELGTPDAVEAAVRVCRHLIDGLARRGVEKLSLIGMLASLERRAGRADVAGELEGQFLGAMRRRMHRATLEDVVRVAAREYLPIGRLREVPLPTGGLPPPEDLPRRERAIAFAVRGEPTALALFAQGDDPLDRRYLAELTPSPVRRASRPRSEHAIGRVLAAAVYHLGTRPKGFLHEVAAYRMRTTAGAGGVLPPDEIHGNLTPELRAAVRSAFISVRDYARAKFPAQTGDLDDYVYVYKLPKEDEQSGGLSAGLPTALAFLSVFLQRPVPRDVASSGALVCEAHDVIAIGPIGEAEHKVRAAYHGNLRSLLLPLANRDELERSTLVPRAITHEVVRFVADLDHAVRLVFARS
ncbi:MAG: hypothetical protein KIT31_02475, partial [Deltaproteobacteria bacterium]|nr:hypothetical protein [Deltaproteobacteria bacterium]